MSERVPHLVRETSLGKFALGERVHLRARHARLDIRRNPFVCPAHGLVDAHLLVACAADAHRARRVRAIATYACAKVEDDEITSLELAVRGDGVRLGAVGSACDDVREGELACPETLHGEFELE